MIFKINFLIVRDDNGNEDSAACEEWCDIIQLSVGDCYFESDAYHVTSWARENNLSYYATTREIEISPALEDFT